MQNTELNLNVVDEKQTRSNWYMLYLKNWNYTHWLVTSAICSLIFSEVAAVVLSAYSGVFSSIWLVLGITSSLSIAILSGAIILSFGLFAGWLLYACHLGYQATSSLEFDYEPLAKLWSVNGQNYGFIFKKLLKDDHFLALSRHIKYKAEAKGLHDYLQNPKNNASSQKVLHLLDRLWSANTLDQQAKMAGVFFLSSYMQSADAEDHIDNIFMLSQILWQNNVTNQDLFVKVIENSSRLKPHKNELQSLSAEVGQLSQYIADPSLLKSRWPLGSAVAAEEFKTDDESRLASSAQNATALQVEQTITGLYEKKTDIRQRLWHKLIQHPQLVSVEALIQRLAQSADGLALLADENALAALLDVSFDKTLEADNAFMPELAIRLYQLGALSPLFMQMLQAEKPLEISLQILKQYQTAIYSVSKSRQSTLDELHKILIDNQKIIDKCLDPKVLKNLKPTLTEAIKIKTVNKPIKMSSMFCGVSSLMPRKKTAKGAAAEDSAVIEDNPRLDFLMKRDTVLPKPTNEWSASLSKNS